MFKCEAVSGWIASIVLEGEIFMNRKWNEKNTLEKIVTIISVIALCIWLLFEFLESRTSLQYANTVNCIAIFVICVCEAISFWKVKRSLSYVAIGGAICMIAVLVLEAMLLA